MSLAFCFKVQGSVKRHGVKVKTVDFGGVLSGSRFPRLSEPMGPRVSVPFSPILALGPPAASPGCLSCVPAGPSGPPTGQQNGALLVTVWRGAIHRGGPRDV